MIAVLFTVTAVNAQVLFSENFDDGNASSRWEQAELGTSNAADFAFDYVNAGLNIPAAPGGGGLGLKLEVNTSSGEASQLFEYPIGQTFTGSYTLSFDVWTDYEDGGSGTTEYITFGVDHTDEVLPSSNGMDFSFTCDWGSGHDIWCYSEGVGMGTDTTLGYYTGTDGDGNVSQNGNGTALYESAFDNGTPGWQWIHIDVSVDTDSVAWFVNDIMFAKFKRPAYDGNITLGLMDLWSSIGTANFTIYDNVVVKSGAVSVKDIKANTATKLYPIPATDVLNVVVAQRSDFELINTIGQVVRSRTVEGRTTINVSDLSPGMYIARIKSANGQTEIHKVLVK